MLSSSMESEGNEKSSLHRRQPHLGLFAAGSRATEKHLQGHYLRKDWTDGDPYFEAPFYILKYTYCATVLTEKMTLC